MRTIHEIEQAVLHLPPEQLSEFRAWFDAFDAEPLTVAQAQEIHNRLDALEAGELPPAAPWEKVKAWLQTPHH